MESEFSEVLIVDDDDEILRILTSTLQKLGYKPFTAIDGVEALELFHEHKFRLVISDLSMPNLNGVALLSEIKKIDPSVFVAIMTGYIEDSEEWHSSQYKPDALLLKPFRIQALKEVIEKYKNSSSQI
ncbi:response regulator [Calditrichota bacterium]